MHASSENMSPRAQGARNGEADAPARAAEIQQLRKMIRTLTDGMDSQGKTIAQLQKDVSMLKQQRQAAVEYHQAAIDQQYGTAYSSVHPPGAQMYPAMQMMHGQFDTYGAQGFYHPLLYGQGSPHHTAASIASLDYSGMYDASTDSPASSGVPSARRSGSSRSGGGGGAGRRQSFARSGNSLETASASFGSFDTVTPRSSAHTPREGHQGPHAGHHHGAHGSGGRRPPTATPQNQRRRSEPSRAATFAAVAGGASGARPNPKGSPSGEKPGSPDHCGDARSLPVDRLSVGGAAESDEEDNARLALNAADAEDHDEDEVKPAFPALGDGERGPRAPAAAGREDLMSPSELVVGGVYTGRLVSALRGGFFVSLEGDDGRTCTKDGYLRERNAMRELVEEHKAKEMTVSVRVIGVTVAESPHGSVRVDLAWADPEDEDPGRGHPSLAAPAPAVQTPHPIQQPPQPLVPAQQRSPRRLQPPNLPQQQAAPPPPEAQPAPPAQEAQAGPPAQEERPARPAQEEQPDPPVQQQQQQQQPSPQEDEQEEGDKAKA